MDIDLTEDQELFVATSARFIESAYPLSAVRAGASDGADPGDSYRQQAAELGWFAMLVPEDLGGGSVSDNAVEDCALIAYTRGASLQPAAFVGINIVAYALAAEGNADQQAKVLPNLLAGTESASWAVTAPGGDFSPTAGVVADAKGGAFVLSGAKTLVQDADRSDWLLVSAKTPAGPAQFLVATDTVGVTIKAMTGLDISRRLCEVTFDAAEVPSSSLVGAPGQAADLIERQLQIACVLAVAESVGSMNHDLEMTVQYAKDRTAFGRPIGSFQAVKHLLADTSLMLEMSKAMAAAAAKAVGRNQDDAAEVASMAKAFVADSAMDLAQNCFQVFGGIGYTWEHDQHLYLRRLAADAVLYGDAAWHRERLCRLAEI